MIYEKIAGEFGCVNGELSLQPGLNVVYAPNECGKSTWCALVRATLYGVESAERAKAGVMPVKTKYLPWSGRPAFGRLTVKKDDRAITLTRQTARTRMFGAFSAVYADTNETVAELDAATAGETLTGVTADVFTRSLFCSGDQMAVSENAELEKKIAAIAGTGDDEISATQAIKQLNAWKNERRHNKTGKLPQIEAEIAKNTAELNEISALNREILELDASLRDLRAERAALMADAAIFEALDTAQNDARIAAADEVAANAAERAIAFRAEHALSGGRGDYATCVTAAEQFRVVAGREVECRVAEAEYYRAESRARAAAVCPTHLRAFDGLTAQFAREQAEEDRRRVGELSASKAKYLWFLATILAFGAGIGLKLPQYTESMVGWACLFFGIILGFVFAAIGISSILHTRKNRSEAEAICASYGAEHPDAILALAAEYDRYAETAYETRVAAEDAGAKLATLQEKHAQATERAEELATLLRIPFNAESAAAAEGLARLNRQLEDLCTEAERTRAASEALRAELAERAEREHAEAAAKTRMGSAEATEAALLVQESNLRQAEQARAERIGRLSHFADFAYLSAETARLREEHARLSQEYDAITLAIDWITESADELARRLTPKLCSRASELFGAMTGGKYGEVLIDKHFAAEVIAGDSAMPRSMLQLSRGALDQLYLAMRLALSEIFFTDELPPLMLDDCFAAFDDERTEQTMAILAELARSRQIVLFTCRKREYDSALRHGANAVLGA